MHSFRDFGLSQNKVVAESKGNLPPMVVTRGSLPGGARMVRQARQGVGRL